MPTYTRGSKDFGKHTKASFERSPATEYYRLTGKPLGVTGEVAEYVAAEILGLTLIPLALWAMTRYVGKSGYR
jgi:hypothetical protein